MIKTFYPEGTIICCPECDNPLLETKRVMQTGENVKFEDVNPLDVGMPIGPQKPVQCGECGYLLRQKFYNLVVPGDLPDYDCTNFMNCPVYKKGHKSEGRLFRCKHDAITKKAKENNWAGIYCGLVIGCKAAYLKYMNKKGGEK